MAKEIERKFLVKGNFKSFVKEKVEIKQGYLSIAPERTVRIRIKGESACITIKGIAKDSGVTRFEWEKEISLKEAKSLFELCVPGIIEKTRYIIPEGSGLFFEIDEFHGNNKGLLIAEIELPEKDHKFSKPGWLGKEVTGIKKYYNSMLVKNPFNTK